MTRTQHRGIRLRKSSPPHKKFLGDFEARKESGSPSNGAGTGGSFYIGVLPGSSRFLRNHS
ncbi:hypothetical protein SBA1_550125 [Candidatus Sulfotelmatobacter kueseliae]|uniref:Uncharacterized protein n=1 Tax=Candidatus Sulfotelmatobacter kueseliae TaxID=2042962 RepID=A0A2U3KYT2_9BACT|nr:hypothetical protein SBA1_550125 [Candidatus Sulfotelmatobacter kueseliae]